jgi:hypothetical protein
MGIEISALALLIVSITRQASPTGEMWVGVMVGFLARYAKAGTALVGSVASVLLVSLQHGSISRADWVALAVAALTAVSVATVPNKAHVPTVPTTEKS